MLSVKILKKKHTLNGAGQHLYILMKTRANDSSNKEYNERNFYCEYAIRKLVLSMFSEIHSFLKLIQLQREAGHLLS